MIGVAYAVITHYIPLIYVDVVLCGGAAFLIGAAICKASKIGHLRSPIAAVVIGLAAGLAAEYFQWVTYLTMNLSEQAGGIANAMPIFGDLVAKPVSIVQFVIDLSQYAALTIKGRSGSGGTEISGIALQAIWAIEGLVLIIGAALAARGQSKEPYSEVNHDWMTKENLPPLAPPEDPKALGNALRNGSHEALLQHAPTPIAPHVTVALYSARSDNDAYITVHNVTTKGKKKTKNSAALVTKLRLTAAQAEKLKSHTMTAPILGAE